MKIEGDGSGNRKLADAATILQDLGLPYHYDPSADLSRIMASVKRSKKPAIVNTQGHAVTVYEATRGSMSFIPIRKIQGVSGPPTRAHSDRG